MKCQDLVENRKRKTFLDDSVAYNCLNEAKYKLECDDYTFANYKHTIYVCNLHKNAAVRKLERINLKYTVTPVTTDLSYYDNSRVRLRRDTICFEDILRK